MQNVRVKFIKYAKIVGLMRKRSESVKHSCIYLGFYIAFNTVQVIS